MSEAEVSIAYRTLPVAILNRSLVVLLPIGLIYLIWVAVVLSLQVGTGALQAAPSLALMLVQVFIYLGMIGAAFVTGDKSVFLSREGISVPFPVMPAFALRSEHRWSELGGVHFRPSGKRGILTVFFRDGARAEFNLHYLSPAAVEQFIVAIDVWGGGSDAFPALLEARAQVCGDNLLEERSYTSLWEEELARRFGATNFIPLEPGQKLRDGALTVERQLAFGGLSAIYLVRDAEHNASILKEAVVPADADEDLRQRSIEMLGREARYLADLNHPGLTRVVDYFVEDDRHYLIMEYVKGEDLRSLVREEGARSPAEVIKIGCEAASILAYLHEHDPPIVHRDLTPDNMMIRPDGTLAIIDFGAANYMLGTATQTLIGKHAYMPPEQLRGKAEPASDIYALGATLFFLLSGQDPEPLSVSHPGAVRSDVPAALDELIASLTALAAGDRPHSARQVASSLSEMQVS